MSIEDCHDKKGRSFEDNALNKIKSYSVKIVFSLADGGVDGCGFILGQDIFLRRFGMLIFVHDEGWVNVVTGLEITVEVNIEDGEVIG